MAKERGTIWHLDRHTHAKHLILRNYLQAWLPILTTWHGRVLYIDGFAGPGKYSKGEDGSPLIAINTALTHRAALKAEIVFLFIEADRARFEHLEGLIRSLKLPPNFCCECVHGRFDEEVAGLLDYLDAQKARIAPTFAFIDPFGFSHTPFSLVKRIMENPRCEVLITFMYEAINRFLAHPHHPETYDALFGTQKWRDVIPLADPDERRRRMHDIYLAQLQRDAGIPYVRSFEMIDRGNKTEYFLVFGTRELLGLKKMKEAMWRVDKSGHYQFSDATDPAQPVLFEPEPDYRLLRRFIQGRFTGREVSVEELEEWIVAHTPFRETHYKRRVLAELEREEPPLIRILTPRLKRWTYPAGTRIRFLTPGEIENGRKKAPRGR